MSERVPPRISRSFTDLDDGRHIAFEMPFDMTRREIEFARALFEIQISGCERRATDVEAAPASEPAPSAPPEGGVDR